MKSEHVPVRGKETDTERCELLMDIYADAASRKSVEDAVMKAAKEEILSICGGTPTLLDENGRLELGKGYVRTSSETKVVTTKKFDWGKVWESLRTVVKPEFNKAQVKLYMADGDKRKELLKLGVDLEEVQELKLELRKAA